MRVGMRTWTIKHRLPREYGWYRFQTDTRTATLDADSKDVAGAVIVDLHHHVKGFLVGNRLVKDDVQVDLTNIISSSEEVHLIADGLDRFARVVAGRTHENGPLVFCSEEMPLGMENDVMIAYLDKFSSVNHIKGVPPALDVAFRLESKQREDAEKRRIELERLRREEEEKRAAEERRAQIVARLGDGAGRRAMAAVDFPEAAKAALAVGGAEFLDHRKVAHRNEMIVRFRFNGRRFECVCDMNLHIIDSGICLVSHDDDDDEGFGEGERGDDRFTLESLPVVIAEAMARGILHVFRHAG